VAAVAASATVVTLWAGGTGRNVRLVSNDSTVAMYIKFGSAASLTDFTIKVAIGGYYELPQPLYGGIVTAIWDAGPTGNARLTEY
jgi:hypothetical protein